MPGRLEGIHVLVVDDDPDILAGIELALRTEGATTETAGDGAAAIRAVGHRVPDLVVLDVMLPAASGFVVLEKIRALTDPPPIIMVTANQGRRHQTYAQTLGADAYFYKPVSLTKLIERAVDLTFEDVDDDDTAADGPSTSVGGTPRPVPAPRGEPEASPGAAPGEPSSAGGGAAAVPPVKTRRPGRPGRK